MCRCQIGRDRSARPAPDTQAGKGKAGDRNDGACDDPDQLLHGVTPDNCRRPRLGPRGRLLRSGRAKASCVASIFAPTARAVDSRCRHPRPLTGSGPAGQGAGPSLRNTTRAAWRSCELGTRARSMPSNSTAPERPPRQLFGAEFSRQVLSRVIHSRKSMSLRTVPSGSGACPAWRSRRFRPPGHDVIRISSLTSHWLQIHNL